MTIIEKCDTSVATSENSSAVAPQPYSQHAAQRGDSDTSGAKLSHPDSFSTAVMNWIGEATSQLTALLEGERLTDDDRQVMISIMGEACERCWSAHGFSGGSRTGQINRTPERQSPDRERQESQPLDDTRPGTTGEATGGRGHHIPDRPQPIAVGEELGRRLRKMNDCIAPKQEPVAWAVRDARGLQLALHATPERAASMAKHFSKETGEVIPLYAHQPQDRVVWLPRHLLHHQGLTEALDRAGVKWEVHDG